MVTPYRVWCHSEARSVNLTQENYDRQIRAVNERWACPNCGSMAAWDDAWYEAYGALHGCRLMNATPLEGHSCSHDGGDRGLGSVYNVSGLEIPACFACPLREIDLDGIDAGDWLDLLKAVGWEDREQAR